MASNMIASSSVSRPCLAKAQSRVTPRLAVRSRTSVAVRASAENKAANVATAAAGVSAAAMLLPQAASAAQEVMVLAEGEPFIVTLGWSALAVSFSMSLAFVVWGRSGL
ncbi:hypothetical protein BSKO_11777 [Bryopsis sp. KO-2023]|nr:hypothetical protein BSKO_11777 [Bryopsis sp. KO-2023]